MLRVWGFNKWPTKEGTLLTKNNFVARVKRILTTAGIDAARYSGHSFRISAATMAAANGISDTRYICTPCNAFTGLDISYIIVMVYSP